MEEVEDYPKTLTRYDLKLNIDRFKTYIESLDKPIIMAPEAILELFSIFIAVRDNPVLSQKVYEISRDLIPTSIMIYAALEYGLSIGYKNLVESIFRLLWKVTRSSSMPMFTELDLNLVRQASEKSLRIDQGNFPLTVLKDYKWEDDSREALQEFPSVSLPGVLSDSTNRVNYEQEWKNLADKVSSKYRPGLDLLHWFG